MGKYQAYPEYKDSEIDWLGEIPSEWKIARFKWLNNHGKAFASGPFGSSIGSKFYQDEGIPVIRGNNLSLGAEKPKFKDWGYVYLDEKKADELSNAEVLKGDLVFTARGTVGQVGLIPNSNELSWGRAILSANQLRFRNHGKALKSDFLWYLFSSWFVRTQVTIGSDSVAQPNLNLGSLKDLHLIVPSINEQTQIANFLDHETAKIDTLIEKQQQLIKLLKEKRQAVISHAVTKGLNPQAPTKDSGVEWLGEVPEHWDVCKLSYRYEVLLGKMLDEKKISGNYLGKYLRNTDVQWDSINTDNLPEMDFRPQERDRYSVKKGDLIVCEGGEIGRCGVWESESTCFYQKALHRLRPLYNTDLTRFMFYVLFDAVHQERFISGAGKATIAHLPAETFKQYRFAFPPREEQQSIINFLDSIKGKFDLIENKAKLQIELLKERRTALISAAVTGKIDVRNWQAPISQNQALEQTA